MRALMLPSVAALLLGLTSGFAARGAAQTPAEAPVPNRDAFFGMQNMRLWPGRAPQAISDEPDEVPTLTVFAPQPGRDNGTAVVVAPGGGYMALAGVLEGRDVAAWFTAHGVTAFVLAYRVGPKARLPIPLLDGARAVRTVRADAARWHIAPDRIGMIGFSAGGHLAAITAGAATAGDANATDPVERVSSRPDFLILAYPWLEGTAIDATGQSQYCLFASRGRTACNPKDYLRFRPVDTVTANFPPTFIYHTTADSLVRPAGSLTFYSALVANKVPVELHLFARGEHGSGLGGADPALARWPDLMEQWLRQQGLLDKR